MRILYEFLLLMVIIKIKKFEFVFCNLIDCFQRVFKAFTNFMYWQLLNSNKWYSFLIVVQFFSFLFKSNNYPTKCNTFFEQSLKLILFPATSVSVLSHKSWEVFVESKPTGKYLLHRRKLFSEHLVISALLWNLKFLWTFF